MKISKKRSLPHPTVLMILAVGAGMATGRYFGTETEVLGQLGMWIIQVIKVLAIPLIFFSIVDGMGKTGISLRSGVRLLSISGANAVIAGVIALSAPALFPVAPDFQWSQQSAARNTASSHLPPIPFVNTNIIHVIGAAILIGVCLRLLSRLEKRELNRYLTAVKSFAEAGLRLISMTVGWAVKVIPISVFAVVASVVGKNGLQVFTTLSHFVLLVTGCLLFHALVFYSGVLKFIVRTSPGEFFRNAAEPLVTAFGTGSSLATLPTTLKTLIEKMKVTPESARLSACIGTNLNHVGILLYEAVTALFIAQAYGISLGLPQKITLLGSSIVAAIGIAGIPDAGLITLSLVLSSVHLPLETVPVLMTVDWFIGRLRASVNVTSDLVVAHLLDSPQKSPNSATPAPALP